MIIKTTRDTAGGVPGNSGDYFATVIDSVGDGVIVVGRDGTITLYNPAAEEITGFSRRQALGNSFEKLFSLEATLLEMVTKTIRTGITISDHENVVVRATGKVKPVVATCYPLTLASGASIPNTATINVAALFKATSLKLPEVKNDGAVAATRTNKEASAAADEISRL